jgi:pimeloyl-ACP methyl ester carboxylesterase
VVAFDYRGYGASTDAPLDEDALYADARAVYRYMVESLAVPPWRLVLYGHSLGSGVASYLASQVPAAGLILEGAFTSVPAVGQERFPFMPVQRLARNRFDNAARLPGLAIPVLLLHARADATIPFEHAERLLAVARPSTRLVDLAGDHADAWEADRPRYLDAFAGFIRLATTPASMGADEP